MMENKSLFDDNPRTDGSRQEYSEPSYTFFNRSNRPEVKIIRETLDKWFSYLPVDVKTDIIGRIQSRDDDQFQSALFEIFLHALLRHLECEIIIHPDSQGRSPRRPDFYAIDPMNNQFIVEAIVTSGKNKYEKQADQRLNEIYDIINSISTPEICFSVSFRGTPKTLPRKELIKRKLYNIYSLLDIDVLRSAERGSSASYGCYYIYIDDLRISLRPMYNHWGASTICSSMNFLRPAFRAVQSAIDKKASSYGKPDIPLIIAINVYDNMGVDVCEYDVIRAIDCADRMNWPKVSGILLCKEMSPFSFAKADVRLYHNPDATVPYMSVLTKFPQARFIGDTLVMEDGKTTGEILNLPINWPNQDNKDSIR